MAYKKPSGKDIVCQVPKLIFFAGWKFFCVFARHNAVGIVKARVGRSYILDFINFSSKVCVGCAMRTKMVIKLN
jgi:hypothetical protein